MFQLFLPIFKIIKMRGKKLASQTRSCFTLKFSWQRSSCWLHLYWKFGGTVKKPSCMNGIGMSSEAGKQSVWFTVDGEEKNGIGGVREILLRVREIQRESGSNFPWMERALTWLASRYIMKCVLHKPSARWNIHRKMKTVFHKSIFLHTFFFFHVMFVFSCTKTCKLVKELECICCGSCIQKCKVDFKVIAWNVIFGMESCIFKQL